MAHLAVCRSGMMGNTPFEHNGSSLMEVISGSTVSGVRTAVRGGVGIVYMPHYGYTIVRVQATAVPVQL